jgi:PAS domain S-box-containing protein
MLKNDRNTSWNESGQLPDQSSMAAFPLWQKALLFALTYFACADLGHFLSGSHVPFVTFWLPAGLYVAVLLLNETREWPLLALAAFPANLLFDLSIGTPFSLTLFFYAINTLQAFTGAWLVRRYVAERPSLGTLGEFFGLIGLSGAFSAIIFAAVAAAVMKGFGLSVSFTDSWKIWWGSNAMAILLVAPFVLAWFSRTEGERKYLAKPEKLLEAALLVLGLAVGVWYVFAKSGAVLSPQRAWLAPFLLWAGLRFGARGATLTNLLLALFIGYFFNQRFIASALPNNVSSVSYLFTMQFVLAMGAIVALVPALVLNERERMLAKLRESEERFRNLAAASFEGIAITEKGLIVDGNEQFFKIFGCVEKEMVGTEARQWVAPESREKIAESAQPGNDDIHEHTLLRKDGSPFHAETRIKTVQTNDRTFRVTAVRDITERKRAVQQIMEQAALLDETSDAIIVRTMEGKVLYWNKGAERMYGWTVAEAVGRDVGELLGIDTGRHSQAIETLISSGKWSGELEHTTKDGRKLIVEARLSLVHGKEGNPVSVLGINTDVTEKKKIESQFMRAQRMESIGNLAGGIAHDLNNILAPILMSIDVLKDSIKDPHNMDILETIEVSATRGAAIVRQVLSFARGLEGSQIDIQPENLIKDIHRIVKDTFPKNIRLQTTAAQEGWRISGDPTQLYQVLLNLCVNARDAMPQGGLIRIDIRNHTVDGPSAAMHLQSKIGPYVAISITDTGVGIPRENLDKIFEPFFTTKKIGSGSGLGLSTLLAVVKSHGGFINVESELNKGTTFSLYLPAKISAAAPEERVVETRLPRGNGEVILLVDDEDSILRICGQMLKAFGYQVITAPDGKEALAVYEQRKDEIAAVITDMMMPVMDGPASIQAMRNINPAVKIIAASGLNSTGRGIKPVDTGVKYFLLKPYNAQTLLNTLRDVLDEA